METCLTFDPLLRFDTVSPESAFASSKFETLLDMAAKLPPRDPEIASLLSRWTIDLPAASCKLTSTGRSGQGQGQHVITAINAVVKAAALARVPIIVWSKLASTLVSSCKISDSIGTLQFMVPFDAMTGMDHFSLLYVIIEMNSFLNICFLISHSGIASTVRDERTHVQFRCSGPMGITLAIRVLAIRWIDLCQGRASVRICGRLQDDESSVFS